MVGLDLKEGFYKGKITAIGNDSLVFQTLVTQGKKEGGQQPVQQLIPVHRLERVSVMKSGIFLRIQPGPPAPSRDGADLARTGRHGYAPSGCSARTAPCVRTRRCCVKAPQNVGVTSRARETDPVEPREAPPR